MISTEEQKRLDEELLRECQGYTRRDIKPDGAYIEENWRFFNLNKIKRLIEAGADVNAEYTEYIHEPEYFTNPFPIITENARLLLLELEELRRHMPMEEFRRSIENPTLLHIACSVGSKSLLKLLIDAGANVNAKDKAGWSPLAVAVREDNRAIIKLLIETGADVNSKSYNDNKSLFHHAFSGGNVALVKLLISAGADVNAKNKMDKIPLDLAGLNFKKIKSMLKNHDSFPKK